jgi:transposase InsO family protein
MGAVGTSADNAACESFHASLKRETLQGAHDYSDADTRPGTSPAATFDLADTIITVRSLIRRSWTTHRWDERLNRRP